ncbi:FAD-dependent oxidoreductase [Actinosynnema sp. CS-041913]|uniref:FAD-dependent oxidoreductase n=1 Tax=Actinosynnema sp. CS-041913 TaxID=3239917 RepID=UPI003D8E0D4D
MRVGIVGAGIAGLVTAWLIDEVCTAVVVEARSRIGGNARSVTGCVDGVSATFDLGAQEIAADDSSPHSALLTAVGFGERHFADIPSSHTFWADDVSPSLVGSHPGRPAGVGHGPAWEPVKSFLDGLGEPPAWDVPFGEVVASRSLPPQAVDHVLYALIASLFGCAVPEVAGVSARAALTYLAGVASDEAMPVRILRGGMESLSWAVAGQLTRTEIRTGTAVDRIERTEGGYVLSDTAGGRCAVERLVLAVPPPTAVRLLPESMTAPGRPWHVLHRFACRPVRYALHLDPVYMPGDRSRWSTHNVVSHDGWAESSFWYGPSYGVDVFKSQITHRSVLPRQVLATSAFEALPPTADLVRAQRTLAMVQGHEGLHFAGHYTAGPGDQETAIDSAAEVARRLAPGSSRLRHLTTP